MNFTKIFENETFVFERVFNLIDKDNYRQKEVAENRRVRRISLEFFLLPVYGWNISITRSSRRILMRLNVPYPIVNTLTPFRPQ